jgi:hypothetical protein
MHSSHTTVAKELDSDTIDTTIDAIPTAKFTPVVGEDPPAFKSDELVEESIAFGCP